MGPAGFWCRRGEAPHMGSCRLRGEVREEGPAWRNKADVRRLRRRMFFFFVFFSYNAGQTVSFHV